MGWQAPEGFPRPAKSRVSPTVLYKGVYYMDTNVIMELWTNGGIPVLMAAYIWYQSKIHREEIGELRKSLDSLTESVAKLLAFFEVKHDEYRKDK